MWEFVLQYCHMYRILNDLPYRTVFIIPGVMFCSQCVIFFKCIVKFSLNTKCPHRAMTGMPQMVVSFGRWGSAGGNVALGSLKIALGHSHLLASFPGRHRIKTLCATGCCHQKWCLWNVSWNTGIQEIPRFELFVTDIWCRSEKLSPILVCFVENFTSEFIRILIYISFISHGIMFLSGGITNLSFLVASYFIS